MNDLVIVARPLDGAPVVLAPTSALVWAHLEQWRTVVELDSFLALQYPAIKADERLAARVELVALLMNEDLIESG